MHSFKIWLKSCKSWREGGRRMHLCPPTKTFYYQSSWLKPAPPPPRTTFCKRQQRRFRWNILNNILKKYFEQYFTIFWEIFSSWRAEGCPGKTKGQTFLLKRVDLHTSRSKLGRASKHHPKHKSKFWKYFSGENWTAIKMLSLDVAWIWNFYHIVVKRILVLLFMMITYN